MDVGARVLADRYELLSPLARGGMGQVWRARDRLLGRAVAVKILRSEFTDDPSFRARFRAEAQHAAMMVHPNIASVFDYGEVPAEGTGELLAYLVMELVEGESLAHLLRRQPRLGPDLTVSILRQTAAALAAAHAAGIVHRDIKPGNVLVAPDGTVKITDFGVAWSASSVPLTRTGQVIGTAHYLSPEQAQGAKATPASDLYALGAIAYECLAGRRVFDGESSVQVAVSQIRDEPDPLPHDVPPDLRALVERLLAKDPAARYADGAALLADVDRVRLDADPSSITRTAVLPTLPFAAAAAAGPATASTAAAVAAASADRPSRRRRLLWPAVGALLAVVAIVLGLTLVGGGEDPAADTTPTTSAPSSSSATSSAPAEPSTVAVDAAALVGRQVAEAEAFLVARGLAVERVAVTAADVPQGQVTAVAPGGDVPIGATVILSYAVTPPPAPEPPAEDGGDEDERDERGSDEESAEERKGNGNGRDNGRGKDDDKGNDKKDD